ncbi:MAG: alpha/beta fold hydrolase [Vicinamibacteria bacterium]
MNLRFLILLAIGVLAPISAAAAPCLTSTPECAEWVTLGGGPQHSLVYRSYPLDTRNDAITRVFILIHGAGRNDGTWIRGPISNRNADNYFQSAMAAAFLGGALDNTLVIAPRLASNDGSGCQDLLGPNEISYHCNTWRSGGPSLTSPTVTSFDFIDEILRKVAKKTVFPNLKAIVVAGHSAGGQVVNRYEMTNQVHDSLGVSVTYVVSNPSSYAYPDAARPTIAAWSLTANPPGYIPETPSDTPAFRVPGEGRSCTTYDQWPAGLNDRKGYSAKQTDEQIRRQLSSRPTIYLLGELDILPLGGFDGSCPAMAQGPTRLARGQAFAKYANEKFGAKHTVMIVPLCGHNARCIFTSDAALPLIFPKDGPGH